MSSESTVPSRLSTYSAIYSDGATSQHTVSLSLSISLSLVHLRHHWNFLISTPDLFQSIPSASRLDLVIALFQIDSALSPCDAMSVDMRRSLMMN